MKTFLYRDLVGRPEGKNVLGRLRFGLKDNM